MSTKKNQMIAQGQTVNREEQLTAERANEQEHNFQYYEEYRKLYKIALTLSDQLKKLSARKEQAWAKIATLEKKTEDFKDDIRGQPPERKKRFRRTAEEIDRPFQCEVDRCRKFYGSEGSLQQHIKLKHPHLYEARSQQKKSQEESEENRVNSSQFE